MPDAAIVCKALQVKGDEGRMNSFQSTENQCDVWGCNSPRQGYTFLVCRRLYAFSFRVQKIAEVTEKRTLNVEHPATLAMMKACSIGQNRTKSDTSKRELIQVRVLSISVFARKPSVKRKSVSINSIKL